MGIRLLSIVIANLVYLLALTFCLLASIVPPMTTSEASPIVEDGAAVAAVLVLAELDGGGVRLRRGTCWTCAERSPVAYTHSPYRLRTRGRCLPCLHAFLADKYDATREQA